MVLKGLMLGMNNRRIMESRLKGYMKVYGFDEYM